MLGSASSWLEAASETARVMALDLIVNTKLSIYDDLQGPGQCLICNTASLLAHAVTFILVKRYLYAQQYTL